MVKSMTAYGRAEHNIENMVLLAEIRSVNHRYRDVVLRIPRNYQPLEEDLKRFIAERVRRGRVEVSLQIEGNGDVPPSELQLNGPLVKSYLNIFEQLKQEFGIDARISGELLCQFKDIIVAKPEAVDIEKVKPGFYEVLRKALDSYDLMRVREGEALENDFRERLRIIRDFAEEIAARAPEAMNRRAAKLREKIASMVGDLNVDEARLAQEVAILADKADITEELVRLNSHCNQFEEFLSKDDALGRRLDFLLQEINREVNTLSVKASEASISSIVVEMKAELEKIREQIQNVE
ncbi:MAG TPA: YicC family protein [Desulfobacteraceae bacterium]|nr:YicC family protein [Desulfobacteraceae bacterium]